jgi:hypothetical protein
MGQKEALLLLDQRCDAEQMKLFLRNGLELDEKLDFLFHLDRCASCRQFVYEALHQYQRNPRREPQGKGWKQLLETDWDANPNNR